MSLPQYPYTNMSDTNLDWLISTVKKIENCLNGNFDKVLKNIILEKFNTLFADVAYVEDTKTLKLYLNVSADGLHVYHMDNESINVGGDYNG